MGAYLSLRSITAIVPQPQSLVPLKVYPTNARLGLRKGTRHKIKRGKSHKQFD